MSKYKIGTKINYLTILEITQIKPYKKVLCRCDCGKIKEFYLSNIIPKPNTRYTHSCGCKKSILSSEGISTHKMSNTKFYRHWRSMFNRMSEKYINAKSYKNIKICRRWNKFENFRDDMYDLYIIHRNKNGDRNTTLDRINVYGGYNKNNCHWATTKEQALNKKNTFKVIYNNQEIPLLKLCNQLNKNYLSIYHRIKNGKTLEEALFTKLWTRTKKR